jgi:hypothetical protein
MPLPLKWQEEVEEVEYHLGQPIYIGYKAPRRVLLLRSLLAGLATEEEILHSGRPCWL